MINGKYIVIFFNRSYNFGWQIPPQRTWPSRFHSLLPIVLFTDWNGQSSIRLRAVPHFSSGIVERAKRERAWKSPHARKGDTRRRDRKMRDYRLSPSFWTNALFSQRKTLIGSSMEIYQHLSKTRQPLSTVGIITIYRTNNLSRTNNSTEQISRVALVEATKNKANLATDEVRVDNRNHGLVESQSGNNRTVARLLFKSCHQGRNYALQSKDSHYLQKNKRQLKFMSSHDWVTSQFSIVDVVLV